MDIKLLIAYIIFTILAEALITIDYFVYQDLIVNMQTVARRLVYVDSVEINTVKLLVTEMKYMRNTTGTVFQKPIQKTLLSTFDDDYSYDKKIQSVYTADTCTTESTCNLIKTIVYEDLCGTYGANLTTAQCSDIASGAAQHVSPMHKHINRGWCR